MTGPALVLVVAAAVFHAVWNALAKRAQDQLVFLWSSVTIASVVLLPVGFLRLPASGPPAAALPFVLATVVIHAVYFFALGRAYRHGDFSRVYPIARGLGVALVPLIALVVFDERLSPLGTVGVTLVVAGVVSLNLPAGGPVAPPQTRGHATTWALLTGVTIAAYSLVDKAGVRHLDPVPYIALLGLGMSALLAPVVLADRATLTSYLLVLFAFRLSKVGYVVAARELSILFSAFLGTFWLGEGRLGPRLAGAAVVLAGVVCVALAR